ncbi:MAG: TatD family hydrolase [Armatimonadota bacterium]|nr:TatD family hydrolase [Armatimonadota bacterium]
MIYLIDTHAHLNHEDFQDDIREVLERAQTAGVTRIVVPGYDLNSSERAVELAETHDEIYAAVGVHPHDAKTLDDEVLHKIGELAKSDKVVAIGEIGLDFHYDFSPREKQIEAFGVQAQLARELGLPLIVHTREAAEEVLAALRRKTWGENAGVMHHFSGDESFAREALGMGFLLGIAGPITYKKNEDMREVIRQIGIERLVVETDAPYASPQVFRGKRNEPSYVKFVAEKIAELLDLTVEEVAAKTSQNAEELFRLSCGK